MDDSDSVKSDSCSSEISGAADPPDDLCLHSFEELHISSSETDNYNEHDSDLDEPESDVDETSSEPLSPNPNSSQVFDNKNSPNYSPSTKIRSAMKGTREKEGKIIENKVRVKWAPEVYDPPVTSDDHTVKQVCLSYKMRAKILKKEYYNKQKHSKSKSSNGSKSEKKKGSHSSSHKNIDPRMMRALVKHGQKLHNHHMEISPKFEDVNRPKKIITNEKTNEIKFGGNFCRERVASPMRLSSPQLLE